MEKPIGKIMQNQPFTHSEIDIEHLGSNYGGTVTYKVQGYWSGSTITIYVDVKSRFSENEQPIVTAYVNHSTGGRDTDELKCNLTATRNFAHALMHAADTCDYILSKSDEIIKHYEAQLEADKKRWAKEREERERAKEEFRKELERELAENPPMSEEDAKNVLKELIEKAKETGYEWADVRLQPRNDKGKECVVEVANGSRTSFYYNNKAIGKKKLIEKLSTDYRL